MIVVMYGLLFITIVVLDQISKWWAITTIIKPIEVNPLLSFELMLNKGVSWSMFDGDYTPWFVYYAIAIVCMFLLYNIVSQYKMGITAYAEVAVFAGAMSNNLDRVLHGGVVDFITVHYKNWYFPSFNIADVAITLGVMCMIIQLIQER